MRLNAVSSCAVFRLLLGFLLVVGGPLELLAGEDMEVEIMNGLVSILSVICHDAVALDVLLSAYFCDCNHHVTE